MTISASARRIPLLSLQMIRHHNNMMSCVCFNNTHTKEMIIESRTKKKTTDTPLHIHRESLLRTTLQLLQHSREHWCGSCTKADKRPSSMLWKDCGHRATISGSSLHHLLCEEGHKYSPAHQAGTLEVYKHANRLKHILTHRKTKSPFTKQDKLEWVKTVQCSSRMSPPFCTSSWRCISLFFPISFLRVANLKVLVEVAPV